MDNESEAFKILEMNMAIANVHEKLEDHAEKINEQGKTLGEVTNLLAQIRWMCSGALTLFVLDNIGLLAVLKKIIGL